jgi:hypothetical protein
MNGDGDTIIDSAILRDSWGSVLPENVLIQARRIRRIRTYSGLPASGSAKETLTAW